MKNSKELHTLTRQNEKNVQKSQKHDANLQKNSTLFFQVGLIVCLLAAYGALEMRFEDKGLAIVTNAEPIEEDYQFTDNRFKVYDEVIETKEPVKTKAKHIIEPKIIDNDTPDEVETKNLITDETKKEVKEGAKPIDESDLDPEEPDEDVHVNFVEMVPIYPGCEKSKNNEQRKKCMSDKLSKLIKKKFDKDLGSELGLKEGIQRIYVNFRINKSGNVEIMSTRAPHKKLEKEANRIVDKVPQMKPGEQGGEPVSVLYSLPIVFEVRY